MIRSLAAAWRSRRADEKPSRQKKDAVFELAERIVLIAEQTRISELRTLVSAARSERRKPLKVGLELVASGGDAEAIERAFSMAFKDPDPGMRLELLVTKIGLKGIIVAEHPFIILRRMTAQLGPEYFDKASSWIGTRLKRRRYKPETLIVPGEMPDVLRSLSFDSLSLECAIRSAGRDIAAASLAGCPQESVDLVKPLFGKIGGTILEDDAAFLRTRLSGDEIAQAQNAFLEIVRSLEERGELKMGSEVELGTDPAFVAELTKAIMGVDEKALKSAFREVDGRMLATAMQGMEPRAHDRILGALTKKDEHRLLDAIDGTNPFSKRAIQEAGRELASRLVAAAAKTGSTTRDALDRLARIMDWADRD